MKEHEKIAAEIFKQYGLDFKTAERAGGWTNAVWLNGDVALRLSLRKDNDIIHREVKRSKMFPPSVGYPRNIAIGYGGIQVEFFRTDTGKSFKRSLE